MSKIEYLKAAELNFDRSNPRLVEFPIKKGSPEKEIINVLWREMAVNEIVMSILAHGFFENEAMYAVLENEQYIIVEGNRRLAAVKSILNPDIIENSGMNKYKNRLTPQLIEQLSNKLPVIVLNNRQEAWRYIGFKHVNGAAKWGSYAKAQYIASVHDEFGISLDDIAEQIGDANKTVIKLYQGLMLLNQADSSTTFKITDVYHNRIYFSHLYTAIGYEGFQDFLGIKSNDESTSPITQEKLSNLEEIMYWLYGSESKDIKPVINSQNPDLKNLNNVLQNREAIEALRSTNDLYIAYDLSLNGADVLYKALIDSKVALQKALSKISYYQGEDEILKISGTIANTADTLYQNLESVNIAKKAKTIKNRVTE